MAYKVVKKNVLNPQIFLMEVEAPLVAKKAEPGPVSYTHLTLPTTPYV